MVSSSWIHLFYLFLAFHARKMESRSSWEALLPTESIMALEEKEKLTKGSQTRQKLYHRVSDLETIRNVKQDRNSESQSLRPGDNNRSMVPSYHHIFRFLKAEVFFVLFCFVLRCINASQWNRHWWNFCAWSSTESLLVSASPPNDSLCCPKPDASQVTKPWDVIEQSRTCML